MQISRFQLIPCSQHESAGAVFAEFALLVVLVHEESFRGVIFAHYVGGVEDVAQFVAFGAQAVGVEGEQRAVVAQIVRLGREVVRGVGAFEDARNDEG